MPKQVLLEGRPGVGKTTVARRLVALLRDAGVPVSGFTTAEIRERNRRVGFGIETVSGESGVLAHVDLPGPPRVGKYGVDLPAFERLAIPALADSVHARVAVIDELGKMELASAPFQDAVLAVFGSDAAVVATVHAHRHPFSDGLKRRSGIEIVRVTSTNRDRLPQHLAAELRDP